LSTHNVGCTQVPLLLGIWTPHPSSFGGSEVCKDLRKSRSQPAALWSVLISYGNCKKLPQIWWFKITCIYLYNSGGHGLKAGWLGWNKSVARAAFPPEAPRESLLPCPTKLLELPSLFSLAWGWVPPSIFNATD
jgi:hypothetical protein